MPARRTRTAHGGDGEHDHGKTADTLQFEHRFPLEQRSNSIEPPERPRVYVRPRRIPSSSCRRMVALVYRPTHESLDAGSVRDATGRVAGVRHRCRGHRCGDRHHRAAAVVRAGADPGRAVRVRRAAGGRALGQRRVGGGRGGVDARLQLLLPAAALHVHPGRPQQLVLAGGVPRHRRRRQRAGVAVAAARHRVGAAGRDRHLTAAARPGHRGARPHRRGDGQRAGGATASASSWVAPPRPAGRPTPS